MNSLIGKFFAAPASLLILISPVYAMAETLKPDPEKIIRQSTVIVEVHGFDKNNHEISVAGTGFCISVEGYVVTARHLTDDAVAHGASPESITYVIKTPNVVGSKDAPAQLFWKSVGSDEMVLASPQHGGDRIVPLKPNLHPRGDIKLGITEVYTGGFPEGYPLVIDKGIIRSFVAPGNVHLPVWVTNMSFKHGQSGSPVILADGTVVGIVTAIDQDASTIGFITPIRSIPPYLWDDFHEMIVKDPGERPRAKK